MKKVEYNQFQDAYVPYLDNLELNAAQRARLWWEVATTPLPNLARWVIYRALRQPRRIL